MWYIPDTGGSNGYDAGTNSYTTSNINCDRVVNLVTKTELTNITADGYIYWTQTGYRYWSIQVIYVGGTDDPIITIEATYDNVTAQASCTYSDVTQYGVLTRNLVAAASHTLASNGDAVMFQHIAGGEGATHMRIKYAHATWTTQDTDITAWLKQWN